MLCSADVFPLTGRPTHVAHALATRAQDGEILLSRSCDNRWASESARSAPAEARADAEPLTAWALQSLRDDGAASQPFVGRRPELAMILAALDRCTSSRHGRAIVVRGEAGIGKTRLVESGSAAARERGVAVHCAQVFDFGQSPGRRPITTLALSLLGVGPDAPAERTRRRRSARRCRAAAAASTRSSS